MKLFAALLAASTIAVVAPATAQASCGNGGGPPSNGCIAVAGGTSTDNSGDNRGNDYRTTVDSNGVNGSNNEVASIDGNRNRINTGTINRGTLAGAEDGAVRGTNGNTAVLQEPERVFSPAETAVPVIPVSKTLSTLQQQLNAVTAN